MTRGAPRLTHCISSAASDVYKVQVYAFIAAPDTIEDVKEMMAEDADHGSEEVAVLENDIHLANPEHAEDEHIIAEEHEGEVAHGDTTHGEEAGHDNEHYEHLLHQLQNNPWSAIYVAAFFFFMIALGPMAFYAILQVAQAGCSPVLFRVIAGITAYLFP